MSSNKVRKLKAGVFIDGSNLLWAMKSRDGQTGKKTNYNICFGKLKDYLRDNFSPVFYNHYACENNICTKEPYVSRAKKQKKFFNFLEGIGYNLRKKELKIFRDGKTKCDTDVEIVMDFHKYVDDVDIFILISGDSDFLEAIEFLQLKGKYIRIFSFSNFLSWELKEFAIKNPRCSYKILDDLKETLERREK